MEIPVKRTKGGFTLVEFVVAIFIISVGLFAVLSAVQMAMRQNLSNKMQNDAVVLAEQFLATNRTTPYDTLILTPPHSTVTRNIQVGAVTVPYTVITTVTPINGMNSSTVSVEVRWLERGDTGVADGQHFHSHSVSTVITNTLAN